MNEAERDTPWHFENRQRETKFDEGKVLAFIAVLARDLATGKQFSIVVDSDDELRRANDRFRDVSHPTDVLSFPDGEDGYLGDIMISAERAASQCVEYGHSMEDEIQALALHGMLHLNGYDHETDAGEMRKLEERLRRKYGLGSGLIARASE